MRRRNLGWCAAATVMLAVIPPGGPRSGIAQTLGRVSAAAPGGVTTLPVAIPVGIHERTIAGDTARYTIHPRDGIRLLGEPTGVLRLVKGDAPILPITVSLGPGLAAGLRTAVSVDYELDDIRETVTAEVDIRPSPGIAVSLTADGPAVPGSRLRLRYDVVNTGNVADTVELRLESRLGVTHSRVDGLAVGAFERTRGEIILDVEADAVPLPTLVVAKVTGRYGRTATTLEVPVEPSSDFLSSLQQVPMRVFLGSSVGSAGSGSSSVYGIEAEGNLRPGLRFRAEVHRAGDAAANFAFRGLHTGPHLRVQLDSRTFSVAAGDVYSRTAPFAGYRLQGRGATLEAGSDILRVHAHAARPGGRSEATAGGHQLAGGLSLRTSIFDVGVHGVIEERRDQFFLPDQTMRSAYLRLVPAVPSAHSFSLDAGLLSVENPAEDERVTGPALAAAYAYHGPETAWNLTLRRRPMVAGLQTSAPDEIRLAVVTEAPRHFGLTGQAYRVDGPGGGTEPRLASLDGFEAGAFVRRGGNRYELRGRIRRFLRQDEVREHTAETLIDVAAGPGRVQGRLEIGRARGSDLLHRTILRTVAGYDLRAARGWGRLGLAYRRDAWTNGTLSVDVSGAYRLSDILEVHGSYGGAADALDPLGARIARLGAQLDLPSDLAVLVGVERYRTGLDARGVRLSVGVEKGLLLPLPLPRQRSVQGTVFDDLDGDGRQSSGEPYLHDVRLTMGAVTVASKRGHFAFPADASRSVIEIEPESLGSEYLPPPPVAEPDDERLEIAVHRPASLRIEAFLDLDGNGLRDARDEPLGNIEVEVRAGQREAWLFRTTDDGVVEVTAIRPGNYVVRPVASGLPRRAAAPESTLVTLRAGAASTLGLAVSARRIALLDARSGARERSGADGGTDGEGDAAGGRK
ncbi:MAG: COG1470 family protein [Gemmatimonadota bacterium]